jgi:hypothetical protein
MKFRQLGILGAIATHLLLAGCAGSTKDTSVLEGRWRNVSTKYYFSNGTNSTGVTTRCSIEFFKKQSVSECVSSRGTDRIVYAFHMQGPNKYETEVVENKNFPQFVGTRVRTEFRLENSMLLTTSFPPPPKEGASSFPIKVESRWIRE